MTKDMKAKIDRLTVKNFLTIDEVCAIFGTSESRVRTALKTGVLHQIDRNENIWYTGRPMYISPENLEAFESFLTELDAGSYRGKAELTPEEIELRRQKAEARKKRARSVQDYVSGVLGD